MGEKEGPALTGTAKEVFDELGVHKHRVRPIPWLDYLTHRQQEAVYMIERYDQYDGFLRAEVDLRLGKKPHSGSSNATRASRIHDRVG